MTFETSAVRLWKRLSREDRLTAATAFWKEPPQEALGLALGAVVKARKLRPQVARTLPEGERARALAGVLDPGEPLAASLLVALHLDARRPLLGAFLDALGLAHENGIPFYIAAPSTTFDDRIATGDEIVIEERSPDEVTHLYGKRTAPEGIEVCNPAFDVTPARYITGFITEKGVTKPDS